MSNLFMLLHVSHTGLKSHGKTAVKGERGPGVLSRSQLWSQVPSLSAQFNGTCDHSWLTMLLENAPQAWGILPCCFIYANMPRLAATSPFVLLFMSIMIKVTFNICRLFF